MRGSLAGIAAANGVPSIDHYDEIGLEPEAYGDEKIFGLVEYFAATYGEELVLYGGQTATERFYGFKRIRDITTDLDFVSTADGLRRLLLQEKLYYHRKFDILFAVRDNVPVSLAQTHIHDWEIDPGFFRAAETVRGLRCPVRCCSREYSIMLKLRRTSGRLDRGERPFGKDALDIVNVITAPYLRSDLEQVDFLETAALVRHHVADDPDRFGAMLEFIDAYRDHLTEVELGYFERAVDLFDRAGRTIWKC